MKSMLSTSQARNYINDNNNKKKSTLHNYWERYFHSKARLRENSLQLNKYKK